MRHLPLLLAALVTGCNTLQATPTGIYGEGSAITDREGAYYFAQRDAAIAAAQAAAAPIFELEAVPGQTLRIEGLGRIAVRAPNAGSAVAIRQYENEWAQVTGQVLGSVLPLAVGQIGAYRIVSSLGKTTQAVAGTVAALGGQGFEAASQSGQQTADVAIHGQEQIAATGQVGITGVQGTAQSGFAQIGDTAQTGIEATAETGQAGIAGVQNTAESGFAALTATSQFALGELGDTGRFGMSALGELGETGIVEAGRDPLVVTQPAPVIVPPADPVIVTQPDPVIVEQPAPIIVPPADPIIVEQPAPVAAP